MPKRIHSQQGLEILQNDKNGFTVVTLFYHADPRKRSEEWLKESKQGLSPAKWSQEYNIDYGAMQGEKVFPEVKSRRDEIILREGPFMDNVWPSDLPMWGGFDYGKRNPSSFHVYTIFDGVLYCIWELYEPCKNIIEFTSKMKGCPYFTQLKYIAADPDIDNLKETNMKTGAPCSVRYNFETLGINKFLMGVNDEDAWLARMQKHWCGPEVTFKILESCPHMIREFEDITYITMSDRQLETQNYKEAMVDRHNHALDDCKYLMNSYPSDRTRRVRMPSIVDNFSPWKATQGDPYVDFRGYGRVN